MSETELRKQGHVNPSMMLRGYYTEFGAQVLKQTFLNIFPLR